ncbi:sugar ABC transporter permease [candidate division KSB1 bacterium]|nr:sugar ABC transporter permease [candidate division KSB1 bacterium]
MKRKAYAPQQNQFRTAIWFLLPNFIGFIVFCVGPVFFSLIISFSNWNLQQTIPFRWIGLTNFSEMLGNQEFWSYFVNTIYLMLGMPVAIAGSLCLALLLNQRLRGIVVYRTLFYLPTFTSGVALIILWKALYNPDFGVINAIINWFLETLQINRLLDAVLGATVSAPVWLQSTQNILGLDVDAVRLVKAQWGIGARDAIIIMGIWIAIGGNNMLLYLAGLSNIPKELFEAARIDGAGRWATFRYVTWHQLSPTTFFIVIMSFIGGLQGGFEQARVMTEGGPAGTTTTLTYHIYTKAFEEFQIGYASAIAWILFIFIFVLTMVYWKFGNRDLSY